MAKQVFQVTVRYMDRHRGPTLWQSGSIQASHIRVAINEALRGFYGKGRPYNGRDPVRAVEVSALSVTRPGLLPRKIGG